MSLLQRLFGGPTIAPAPVDVPSDASGQQAQLAPIQSQDDDRLDVEKLLQRLVDEDTESPRKAAVELTETQTSDDAEQQKSRESEKNREKEQSDENQDKEQSEENRDKEQSEEQTEMEKERSLQEFLEQFVVDEPEIGERDEEEVEEGTDPIEQQPPQQYQQQEEYSYEAEDDRPATEDVDALLFPSDFDDDDDEESDSVARLTDMDTRPQQRLTVDTLSLTMPLQVLYRRYERARLRYEVIEKAKLSALDRAVAERAEALRKTTVELQTKMAAVEQQMSDAWLSMEGAQARRQLDYLYPVVGDDSAYAKLLQRRSVAESLRFQSLLEQLATNLQASASGEPYTLDKAASAAIGFVEVPARDADERQRAVEFRSTLQQLVDRVNETETAYQRQRRRAEELQLQHLREKRSYELAKAAIRRALDTDGDADDYARLPALAAALKEYGDLRQAIRESYREIDVARAQIERETAARNLLVYVRQAQVRTMRQVERELQQSVQKRLDELTQRESAQRADIQQTLDQLTERRRAVDSAMQTYVREANKQASDAMDRFESAKKAYLDALTELEERVEEIRSDSRWPASLDIDDFERQVQTALEAAGVERLDALSEDEMQTDPEKCKRPPQGVAPIATEFQKAAAELVSGDFEALPGLLLFWDTGTGKTFAGALAIVRSIEHQAAESDNYDDSGQGLVVGFSETNLRSFYEAIDSILRTRYGSRYQPEPLTGGRFSDRSSSATHFDFAVSGSGKEKPAFDGSVTFVRMHLSPQTHLRGSHALQPRALIVVDEVHYLTGAPPRKGAAPANPQTLDKWQSLIRQHAGKRLLLSATPAANDDDPNSLLKTLALIPRTNRPKGAEETTDARQWFVRDADGTTRWASDEARSQFERDWIRGVVSHASLRFDQTVFPAVDTDCGEPNDRACVYRFDKRALKTTLLPASERPPLNMFEMDARAKKDYKNLVPTVVHVPLDAPSVKALLGRRRQQPGLVECMTSGAADAERTPLEQQQRCAEFSKGYTSADNKVHGYKTSSGGGFDAPEKSLALRTQLDAYTNKKHLVVAMMNPNVQSGWTNKPLRAALDSNSAQFDRTRLYPADIVQLRRAYGDDLDALFRSLEPQRRYLDTTGSALDGAEKTFALRAFNHPQNATGRYFEVLVIDGKMLAGTDVPGAHMTHLLSPPHDLKSQKQAYGRILRLCALAAYAQSDAEDARDPTVRVLTYVSTTDPSVKQIRVTPDQLLMQWLGTQRRVMSAVDLMYEQMRLAAVDRYFFGDYSTGGRWRRESSLSAQAEQATAPEEEVGRPKDPMDALDYFLLSVLQPEETTKQQGDEDETLEATKRTQKQLEVGERFTVEAGRAFAERFYRPNPWAVHATMPKSATGSDNSSNDNDAAARPSFVVGEKVYNALRKIAQANRLPDIALISSYIAALNNIDRASLRFYLLEKRRITSPGLLEVFAARADLMRQAELKRMSLVDAWLSAAKQISEATVALSQAEVSQS